MGFEKKGKQRGYDLDKKGNDTKKVRKRQPQESFCQIERLRAETLFCSSKTQNR
jgi:hypothetical protein